MSTRNYWELLGGSLLGRRATADRGRLLSGFWVVFGDHSRLVTGSSRTLSTVIWTEPGSVTRPGLSRVERIKTSPVSEWEVNQSRLVVAAAAAEAGNHRHWAGLLSDCQVMLNYMLTFAVSYFQTSRFRDPTGSEESLDWRMQFFFKYMLLSV